MGQPQAGSVGLRNPDAELPGDPHVLFGRTEQGLTLTPAPMFTGARATVAKRWEQVSGVMNQQGNWSVHTTGHCAALEEEDVLRGHSTDGPGDSAQCNKSVTGGHTLVIPRTRSLEESQRREWNGDSQGTGFRFGRREVLGVMVTAAHLHVCLMPERCAPGHR